METSCALRDVLPPCLMRALLHFLNGGSVAIAGSLLSQRGLDAFDLSQVVVDVWPRFFERPC